MKDLDLNEKGHKQPEETWEFIGYDDKWVDCSSPIGADETLARINVWVWSDDYEYFIGQDSVKNHCIYRRKK